MSARKQRMTYVRDVTLFLLGIVLILKQAGILFPPPEHISVALLSIGALFCNGPLFLQYLTIARGSGLSGASEPSEQAPPSESSSAPSSGGST